MIQIICVATAAYFYPYTMAAVWGVSLIPSVMEFVRYWRT